MLQGRELANFRKRLLAWFRQSQRDLPWRRTTDPYRIWLSEIMLQQTRVAAVIPYYQRFLERFPDIRSLAAAPQEEVLRLWSGLGYYSRARNLQLAAQEIVARHGGVFPRTEKDALNLPGIGGYTSAAILSIAFGAKHAVLDGNVVRVLARIFAVQGDLRDAARRQRLQKSADVLLDTKSPGDWNQAMMELGATLCTPRAPQCLLCPVARFCQARKLGLAESLPATHKKRTTVEVTLASAVFLDAQGRTLLLPPPEPAPHKARHDDISVLVSKMWHFPNIAARADAATELEEWLAKILPAADARKISVQSLPAARHAVTYHSITLRPFRIPLARLPQIPGAKIFALTEVASLSSLAISNLTRKVARAALANPAALSARA